MAKIKSYFNENIKLLRILNNLTQQDVSNKLKIKRPTYCAWEEKRSNPSYEVLIKISHIYNYSIDDLIKSNLLEVAKLRIKRK